MYFEGNACNNRYYFYYEGSQIDEQKINVIYN